MLKNTELLKHSKITLQHVSVYVETIFRDRDTVHDTHALQGKSDFIPHLSNLLFISLNFYSHITYISFITVTICSHSTDGALHIFYADTLNQMCNF